MNSKVIIKVLFLALALTATIYSLTLLNTGHMDDFWTSLGIGKKNQSLNWCTNRLVTLSGNSESGPWVLKEENRQWLIVKNTSDVKILSYLDVEKWLAKYCLLTIDIYRDVSILDMAVNTIATANFNDGTSAKIYTLGHKEIYQINEVIFVSDEWTQALKELRNLLNI